MSYVTKKSIFLKIEETDEIISLPAGAVVDDSTQNALTITYGGKTYVTNFYGFNRSKFENEKNIIIVSGIVENYVFENASTENVLIANDDVKIADKAFAKNTSISNITAQTDEQREQINKSWNVAPDIDGGDDEPTKYVCRDCGAEFDDESELTEGYCVDCIDNHTCRHCGGVFETLESGYCDACAEDYRCEDCGKIICNSYGDPDMSHAIEDRWCEDCAENHQCKNCCGYFDNLTEGYCENCIDNHRCRDCGSVVDYLNDGYCENCIDNHTCRDCGSVVDYLNDGYCENCIDNPTCRDCGSVVENLNEGYCDNCVGYHTCVDCGAIVETIDNGFCDSCIDNHRCIDCESIYPNLTSGYCDACAENHTCSECESIEDELQNGMCASCYEASHSDD